MWVRRISYIMYNGDPKKWGAMAHAVKAHMWPLRLPYGNSDVVSNPNVAAAFGTGNEAGSNLRE